MLMRSTQNPQRPKFFPWLGGSTRGASTLRLVLSLLLFVVLWHVLASYVINNRLLVVPPVEVAGAFSEEVRSGEFQEHLITTGLELLIGFPLSVLGGLLIGAILAGNKPIRQTVDPLLTALYSVPIVALAPLFIAALGFGISSKIAVIILMAIFPIITSTDAGLRSADADLIETAKSFRATRWQVLKTVTLPHSVPFIISGVRVAFARALVGVIVAEFFGAFAGFGYVIGAAAQQYQTARLLAYVIVLGIIGLIASILLTTLERKLAPWKEDA